MQTELGPGNPIPTDRRSPAHLLSGMAKTKTTYDRALNMLAFRARSTQELRRQLLKKGEPADEVERVIERLTEQRLLNDTDFARQYARLKLTMAGSSRFRIVQELGRKGIARPMAEEAIEGLKEAEGIDASDNIGRVATKKWRTLSKLDDVTARRRLYAFLARRGFNPDEIRGALNALGQDAEV